MASVLFRALILAYPPALRRDHGREMAVAMTQEWRARPGVTARLKFVAEIAVDLSACWIGAAPGAARRRPAARSAPAGHASGALSDVKDALRLFAHAPWFTAGSVLTLSLGIGAAAAIFSLADATLLRPLPIPAPDRVVQGTFSWSYPDVRDLFSRQRAFTETAAWASRDLGLEVGDRTHAVRGLAVSGEYFTLAGVTPLAGRVFGGNDDRPEAALTALLSESTWRRLFGADPAIVGRTIRLNQSPITVAGVVPRTFRGLSLAEVPEVYLSLGTIAQLATSFIGEPGALENRGLVFLQVAGRMRPGVTHAQAEQDVDRVYRELHPPPPDEPAEPVTLAPLVVRATGMESFESLQRFVIVLGGATLVTLLLACATVANLLLVRAERRQRELAMRAALGAGLGRLVRLLAIESVAIGLAGAAAGVLVAYGCVTILDAFSLPGAIRIADLDLRLDASVLALAVMLGLLTSLLFGLAPVWRVARLDLTSALRSGGRGSARQPLRSTLVATQVALCVLLLGGGLAFGRAVHQAFSADLGFDTAQTAIITVNPSLVRYTRDQIVDFQRRSLERLEGTPAADSVAWAAMRPLRGRMRSMIAMAGTTVVPDEDRRIDENVVSSRYFETLGIPLIAGRTFGPGDTVTSPPVALLSASAARKHWPAGDALGSRFTADADAKTPRWTTVIGIVGDIQRELNRAPEPLVYTSLSQNQWPLSFGPQYLFVRSGTRPAAAAAGSVAGLLHETDPLVPVTMIQTVRDHVGSAAMAHRLGFTLFALFAALAIVLTTFGVYAVVAYAVARRTREIGIRVAIGARASGVLGLVALQGLRPTAIGLCVGIAGYWLSSGLLEAFLLRVPSFDAITMAAMVTGVAVVALVATIIPARRALAVDPAVTLRAE